jgi:transposase-like protein
MKVESLQALLAQVPSLTEGQLDEKRCSKTKELRVLETAWGVPKCGHSDSEQVVKNGQSRGLRRYCCRACGKTFNAITGTPLTKLHNKERLFEQGECLAKGMTVRPNLGQRADRDGRWAGRGHPADRSCKARRQVQLDSRGSRSLRRSRQRGRLLRPDSQQLPRAVQDLGQPPTAWRVDEAPVRLGQRNGRGFVRWEQDTLVMRSRRISESALHDLLALFWRYQIPMQQLTQFESESNTSWFRAPHIYWCRRVFGTQQD